MTYLVFVLIFVCVIFLVNHIFNHANLPINDILIKGQYQHIDKEQIHLITEEYVQGNFFNVNLYETRSAFKQLPWVRDVDLRRKWPDQLEITIEEHKPIARWEGVGLVNDKGEIFIASTEENLPIFVGPENFVKEMTIKFREINNLKTKYQENTQQNYIEFDNFSTPNKNYDPNGYRKHLKYYESANNYSCNVPCGKCKKNQINNTLCS